MPKIKAFDGYLVKKQFAAQVVSPEYDTVSPVERRRFADDNPQNFLNTMRLRDDFDPSAIPDNETLLNFNRSNLQRLLADGYFRRISTPSLFIYRLEHGENRQTGIVCEIAADEYEQGHIKKHESTRREREDLLAEYRKVVGVDSCPISLAYPEHAGIDQFIARHTANAPVLDFTTGDGVHQTVWQISDADEIAALSSLCESIEDTYLTDGHHRAASGWRYAEIMRKLHGNLGNEPYNQLLVALFSDHELNLLPFHRCVQDLGGLTEQAFLDALSKSFTVTLIKDHPHDDPANHGEFGLLLGDTWYQLVVKPEFIDPDDPVASLDVSLLQDLILAPILGIEDARTDPRLGYVSGAEGRAGLVAKAKEGWAACFACHATSMDQLMHVADAGALMPPKSTYFDPKTRSGLFVRLK